MKKKMKNLAEHLKHYPSINIAGMSDAWSLYDSLTDVMRIFRGQIYFPMSNFLPEEQVDEEIFWIGI